MFYGLEFKVLFYLFSKKKETNRNNDRFCLNWWIVRRASSGERHSGSNNFEEFVQSVGGLEVCLGSKRFGNVFLEIGQSIVDIVLHLSDKSSLGGNVAGSVDGGKFRVDGAVNVGFCGFKSIVHGSRGSSDVIIDFVIGFGDFGLHFDTCLVDFVDDESDIVFLGDINVGWDGECDLSSGGHFLIRIEKN